MSKQDTHFTNVFSMVIALLIVITICLFALARIVASRTQDLEVYTEPDYARGVAARIQPPSAEAIAGRDNSALAIHAAAPSAEGTAAVIAPPKNGTELFEQTCSTCHGPGIAGAPKAGDKAAWAPRLSKGQAVLYQLAIDGFQGSTGVMPPKGGRTDVSDALVKQAVDYMVKLAR